MNLIKVAAGLLTAGLMAGTHAATTLSEGFDDVAGLTASGWVFTNASATAGLPWFQGNSGIFAAQAGAAGAYAAANFNSSTGVDGAVDNWLISPELTLTGGASLTFYTQASDAGFLDLLEVRFSSGSGTATSGFSTLLGVVGDAATASYPVGSWVAVTLTLPDTASGRFAFHYSVPDAINASYIGVDTLTVSAVPEPATFAMLGLGLAAVGAARRRKTIAQTSV